MTRGRRASAPATTRCNPPTTPLSIGTIAAPENTGLTGPLATDRDDQAHDELTTPTGPWVVAFPSG